MIEPRDALVLRLFLSKLMRHGYSDVHKAFRVDDRTITDTIMDDMRSDKLFCWKSAGRFETLHHEEVIARGSNGVADWVASVRKFP